MLDPIRFIILLWAVYTITVRGDCNSIPISLSNFDSCEDNYCVYDTSAIAALPDTPGSSICLEFIPPGANATAVSVNISLESARYLYTSEYSFHDDDPATSFVFTACCASSLTECDNVQEIITFSDNSYTGSLNHRSSDCASSLFGINSKLYWGIGVSTLKRFKFISLNPTPSPAAMFELHTLNSSLFLRWSGNPATAYDNVSDTSVTVISYSGVSPVVPKYIVFDHQSPTDFYMLDSTDVNDVGSCQFGKIGCFGVPDVGGRSFDPAIQSKINVVLRDTQTQVSNFKFDINFGWSDISALLPNHIERLSDRFFPGTILVDPDYTSTTNDYTNIPNHSTLPGFDQPLAQGWIVVTNLGSPTYFGIDLDGHYLPDAQLYGNQYTYLIAGGISYLSGATSNTTLYSLNAMCGQLTVYDEESGNLYIMSLCIEVNDYYHYNYSRVFACLAPIEQYESTLGNCNNWQIAVKTWPNYRIQLLSWNHGFITQETGSTSETAPYLLAPMTNGVFQVKIAVNNKKVIFEETLVRPEMRNANVNTSTIYFDARSVGSRGNCFVSTYPSQLLVSNPSVYLTNSWDTYYIELNIGFATVNATVYLSCFKYIVQSNITLSFNQEPGDTPQSTTSGSFFGGGQDSWYNQVNSWFQSAFGSAFGINGFDWSSVAWYYKAIVYIFTFIALFFIFAILLYLLSMMSFILKPFRFAYNRIKIMLKKKQSTSQSSNYVSAFRVKSE